MRYFFILVIFLLLGAGLTIVYLNWQSQKDIKSSIPVKQPREQWPQFNVAQAPSDSLTGIIQTLSGTVKWESRVATEAAIIKQPVAIHQGEKIVTEKDGSAIVTFPPDISLTILPKTSINFVQTLPQSIVLLQDEGQIKYQTTNSIVSIRSLHLLTRLESAEATIIVDKDHSNVNISIVSGQAQLAFNDSNSITQVIHLKKGDSYAFDDDNRQGSLE